MLLAGMRVIVPWISSNPLDLVSEEELRHPWSYRHMLCVCSLGGGELVHAEILCDGSTNEDELGQSCIWRKSKVR